MVRRRRRREPLWPPALVLGVVIIGLGLGAVFTRGEWMEAPPRTLEIDEVPEERTFVIPSAGNRVRVEVLNAGGVQGMAARARDLLREGGFDVVYYGNAPSFGRDSSVVLDRVGERDAAAAVARSLGVAGISSEPDTALLVDVTVLLGTDWDPESGLDTDSLQEGSDGEEVRGTDVLWWDPRRLLDGAW